MIMNEVLVWEIIKYFLTAFIVVLIPVYIPRYGYANFLWLSDIGLFLTVLALWAHSPLLMSMAAAGVMVMETFWCVVFFARLLFKVQLNGLTDYMFNKDLPLYLRGLSLFHVMTPLIWIFYFFDHLYDPRAFVCFTLLYWLILMITSMVKKPFDNINWVFTVTNGRFRPAWILLLAIAYPLVVVLPTHYFYVWLFA